MGRDYSVLIVCGCVAWTWGCVDCFADLHLCELCGTNPHLVEVRSRKGVDPQNNKTTNIGTGWELIKS